MTDFASAVALPNGYRVKVYLTWSSSHKLYPPSVATFNTNRCLRFRNDIGCPHKICFSHWNRIMIIIFNCGIDQMQTMVPRHLQEKNYVGFQLTF